MPLDEAAFDERYVVTVGRDYADAGLVTFSGSLGRRPGVPGPPVPLVTFSLAHSPASGAAVLYCVPEPAREASSLSEDVGGDEARFIRRALRGLGYDLEPLRLPPPGV